MDKDLYYWIGKDKEGLMCCMIGNRVRDMGVVVRFLKRVWEIGIRERDEV